MYQYHAQFYSPSLTAFHRTSLSPGGFHIQRMMGTDSWYLLELRKSKKQLRKIRLQCRHENFHARNLTLLRLFLHQCYQDWTNIHWYSYLQVPTCKSDLLQASIMMAERNIFGSHKEQHIWLWEKLSYIHRPTPEEWRWKKKVNFIIRTVEFINYSRRSAVKSLHNSVILYNAELGRLVQNYRIKFTKKHASSFGTWWEVCGDDQGKRLKKLRKEKKKKKKREKDWPVNGFTHFFPQTQITLLHEWLKVSSYKTTN